MTFLLFSLSLLPLLIKSFLAFLVFFFFPSLFSFFSLYRFWRGGINCVSCDIDYACTTFELFVFFPWGIPQLQSNWSLSCDHGPDYYAS